MNKVYLLIGGNLDNREQYLEKARQHISREIGRITEVSSIYESEAWGFESDDKFLNQVLLVDTDLAPGDVLQKIDHIEHSLGRKRSNGAYSSRHIDVDILFYNDTIIREKHLKVPHPRLHERMFTLVPLQELDENLLHPSMNKTIRQLLLDCKDTGEVRLHTDDTKLKLNK